MSTTKTKHSQSTTGVDGWFNNQIVKFEESRFGWMAIYITAQSCLGSIACMYILKNSASDLILATCAGITMGSNAIFIAQAPGKWCLLSFYISILINLLFILINI